MSLISSTMPSLPFSTTSTGYSHHLTRSTSSSGAILCIKKQCSSVRVLATKRPTENGSRDLPETGASLKAVWYGAEQFGNFLSFTKGMKGQSSLETTNVKLSREEMIAGIREDYGKNYFVSGLGDMRAYSRDCIFADPFVSFKGTDRFKKNVGNLGSLMRDIKLEVYDWKEREQEVETKWRFSCVLDLPWKPLLAAAGGTTHVMDLEKGQIVEHIERWEVEPSKVVGQLLKPSAKVPTTQLETFLLAASAGDTKGMWFATSPIVLTLSIGAVVISLLSQLVLGEGLPGGMVGLCGMGVVAGLVTEGVKFAQGMQGGETGTGGRF